MNKLLQNTEQQRQQDEAYMRRAMELAQQAQQHNEIPVGAVLVCNGEIIGEGFNQSIMNHDPSAHAEMMAIRAAGKQIENYRLLNATLYVTLEPCPMCAGLLVHSRISRLVYGAKDLKTGAAGSAFNMVCNEKHNHKISVTESVLADECSEMLSAFFTRRRHEIKAQKQLKKQQEQNNAES